MAVSIHGGIGRTVFDGISRIYAGGELMRTLEVRQQAPAPAIATNFTEKQVAASAASFDVLVTCNAEWRAEVSPKDEAWLSLGERTATRLNVVCAVNDTGASREGAVRLYIPERRAKCRSP